MSGETVAMVCRIGSAFYVHLRLDVSTEIVVSILGVILGNRKTEAKTIPSFLP